MAMCLIALGSNLGERIAILREAIARLRQHPRIRVLACSDWFRTRPIGGPDGQGEFVNAAVRLETTLEAAELLAVLHALEQQLGRKRHTRWEARRIDLDLLLFGDCVCHSRDLVLPHPRMAWRRFVLEPAAQVAPDMRHPVLDWTLQRMLEHLNSKPEYIAVTGHPQTDVSSLARRCAEHLGLRLLLDPLPGGERAGQSVRDQVAILQRRANLLDRTNWPAAASGTISDFWIGQSLAQARTSLELGAHQEFAWAWQECQRRVVAPKLIVLLEPAPDPQAASAATTPGGAPQSPVVELRRLATHGGFAPVLSVNAAEPEHGWSELVAAVEAMR